MKVSLELRKKPKDNKTGILNIRIYNNGKRKYRSLKLELEFKYWDKDKQKVKSNYKGYKALNEHLRTLLNKYEYNALNPLKHTNKTALEYFRTLLKSYKETTKANYTKTLISFEKYLIESNNLSIDLDTLNPLIMQGYKEYLVDRNIHNNTIFTHFSILKALINKSIENNMVQYLRHPFTGVKVKRIPTKKEYYSDTELRKIVEFKTDKKHLLETRNIFLFQTFSQGMRITDVLLLKWGNFTFKDNNLILEYVQSKSKKRVVMNVNPMMLSILKQYVNHNVKDKRITEIETKVNNEILELKELSNVKNDFKQLHKIINSENEQYKKLMMYGESYLIKENIEAEVLNIKISLMNKDKNLFINDSAFNKYKSGNDLNKQQLKRIDSIKGNLNNNLKKLAKELKIKPCSTHVARHTYTMLALDNEFSIDNISIALGHSNIKTTYNYIHSLPINQLNDKMNKLANKYINN